MKNLMTARENRSGSSWGAEETAIAVITLVTANVILKLPMFAEFRNSEVICVT
jgi:hypothetical protein